MPRYRTAHRSSRQRDRRSIEAASPFDAKRCRWCRRRGGRHPTLGVGPRHRGAFSRHSRAQKPENANNHLQPANGMLEQFFGIVWRNETTGAARLRIVEVISKASERTQAYRQTHPLCHSPLEEIKPMSSYRRAYVVRFERFSRARAATRAIVRFADQEHVVIALRADGGQMRRNHTGMCDPRSTRDRLEQNRTLATAVRIAAAARSRKQSGALWRLCLMPGRANTSCARTNCPRSR